jgi:hypothetical protein
MSVILNGKSGTSLPAQNSTANATIADVIGNKTDDNLGDSIYARLAELYDQFQNERYVYPVLAAGAAVVSANTDWTYGAYATVVPESTITNPFHIIAVSIESCDEDAVYQLELYKYPEDEIVTAVRFSIEGGFYGNTVYAVGSKEVAANARVRARLASSNGTAAVATITVSIVYFEHA